MTRPAVAALGLATAWLAAACGTVRVEPGQGGGAASTSTGTATHSSTGTSTQSTTASGGAGGAPVDYFEITVDGVAIYRVDATSQRCGVAAYERTLVDLSAYADGEGHRLRLHAETYRHVDVSTFFVDLVSLPSCPAGSGGAGGAPGCAAFIIDADAVGPATCISAPGVPIGLTTAARAKASDRVLHDFLEIGVAAKAALSLYASTRFRRHQGWLLREAGPDGKRVSEK